jgi:hypothetical protein
VRCAHAAEIWETFGFKVSMAGASSNWFATHAKPVVRIDDRQGSSEGYTFDLIWSRSNGPVTQSSPARTARCWPTIWSAFATSAIVTANSEPGNALCAAIRREEAFLPVVGVGSASARGGLVLA